MLRGLSVFVIACSVAGSALADDLRLVCPGSGTYIASSNASVTVRGNSGTVTQQQVESVDATVRFEIEGERARILMPHVMTPPIHNDSDHGWWALDRLTVGEDEISGRFNINVFNKPSVHIDRRTGVIEVSGNFRYYFQGQCELDETDPNERRF